MLGNTRFISRLENDISRVSVSYSTLEKNCAQSEDRTLDL